MRFAALALARLLRAPISGAVVLLVGTCFGAAAQTQTPTPEPILRVSLQGGELTVVSERATLTSILHEVARQGRFDLHVPPSLTGETATVSFDRVELETGVRRLLAGFSHTMVFDPADSGARRLREVRVLSTGGPGSQPYGPDRAGRAHGPPDASPAGWLETARRAARAGLELATETASPSASEVARLMQEGGHVREATAAARRLARKADQEPAAGRLDELVVTALSATDPKAKVEALSSLMAVGRNDPRAHDTALAALRDTHPGVRREAMSGLMSSRDGLAPETLTEVALNDSDPALRAVAVHLAANTLPREQARYVLERAADDGAFWVRSMAFELLDSFAREK